MGLGDQRYLVSTQTGSLTAAAITVSTLTGISPATAITLATASRQSQKIKVVSLLDAPVMLTRNAKDFRMIPSATVVGEDWFNQYVDKGDVYGCYCQSGSTTSGQPKNGVIYVHLD